MDRRRKNKADRSEFIPKLDVKKSVADLYNEKEIKAVRWAEMFE